MNPEQEEAFIRAFIVPDKRERYRQMMARPKSRHKILQRLYHTLDTIPQRTAMIASGDHFPEGVEAMLKRRGAGARCYLIAPEAELDQREMPLREAIDLLINEDNVAVACCVPGRLAYYKAEWYGIILESKP